MMDWNNGVGWHNGSGWGGWLGMTILMILFWGLVVWGIVALVRYLQAPSATAPVHTRTTEATPSANEILAKRYARGEIDEAEYAERLAILQSPKASGIATPAPEAQPKHRTVA